MEDAEDRFEVGDFVFAKVKGHPHWPATISQIETHYANGTSGQERTRYNVYFYGSHQMSMIKVDSLLRFEEHYDLFKTKYANNPKFNLALEELETDKGTREEYVKSLQDCLSDTPRFDVPQEKPDDEMFSSSGESSDEDVTISADARSPTSSSGFGDSFDSDEDYQALQNQKYEILSMERVPYLGSSEFMLVVSLGFREEDLLEDFRDIREEIRMMTCFVKLERLSTSPKPKRRGRGKDQAPRKMKRKRLVHDDEPPDWLEEVAKGPGKKRGRRKKWKSRKWNNLPGKQPSLTILAAEAVKRRRRQRRAVFRDETRLLSLRQRTVDAVPGGATSEGINSCCLSEICTCATTNQPMIITCPICQAQFSSGVDYKQHSFNIHIMGL